MAKTLYANSATEPTPSLIPNERLIAIYTAMVKCRMLQQRAATLFQQGKLDSDLHASSGREACAAAVGVDLQLEDTLSIAAGDWLPAFVKGMHAETLFRVLSPRLDGHSASALDEAPKRNILVNQADQPAMVRERAEALRAARSTSIVAAIYQPSAASSNQWQKVFSAAAARKLPILFVQYGTGGAPSNLRLTRGKVPQALAHGVAVIAVDAADPVALYRVAYEAITRARQRRGATLLECAVIVNQSPTDPATRQPLQPPDPVAIMETYMKSKEIQPDRYNRQVVAEFARDLDLATRFLTA